ncbi:MAG TPA: ABC transporter substrate-binding protein [Kofleriaceae bacterium]|nr:ABC transporter substrate-binding protein [Kofleriaceae bacterium]
MVARLTQLATVIALCATATAPAAGETRPRYGGTVVASLLSEPVSLDPVEARSHAEVTLASLIFDTLYAIDDRGKVQPHLAAGIPTLSADRLTARIALLPDVELHGGGQLGPADVAASLERARRSRTSGWLLAAVRSVRAGKGELVIVLKRDTPELMTLLSAPQLAITPGGTAPRENKAVGTGPFELRTIDRKAGRVALAAAERHFAGRPYLDSIELRWYRDADEEARQYERGSTHVSFRGAAAFSGHQPKYATEEVEGPATVLVYLGFGRTHAAISASRDYRRALSLALARNGFRGLGTGERVVPTVYPDAVDIGGEGTDRAARAEQPAEARAALARAARSVPELRPGASTPTLEVIIDSTRPDDREVAEKVVAALYRLGLRARITELPARTFATRVARGACDLYVDQLSSPVPDATLTIAAAFAAGGDDWTERMLAKTRLLPEGTRVWFQQRLPVLPLFHRAVRAHYRRNLRGLGFDATTRPGFASMFEFGKPTPSRGGR